MLARKLKNNRGQAIVELAILLPVLLLILMSIFEFGRVFNAYMIISHASREGARAGSVGNTDTQIEAVISDVTPTLNSGNMTITIVDSGGSRNRGDSITVTINYSIDLITPLVGTVIGDPVVLDASTVMRIE